MTKIFSGTVVSNKMKDTIVVSVERYEKHPRYAKFIKRRKKFKVHDLGNTAKIGDTVQIVETRPISKDKNFKLITS
ncbi:MAG: 30S ribosomal protein S17 [bacterium]|nr:30S ribosomal protein S17 [bacterium]